MSERPTDPGFPTSSQPRVLVIDGQQAIRTVLTRALGRVECAVLEADCAAAARAFCATRPRLAAVIVELDLRDGSGRQLVAELRAHFGRGAPPFIVFASEKPTSPIDGVVAVVAKSSGLRALLPIVEDIVREFAQGAPSRRSTQAMRAVRALREPAEVTPAQPEPASSPASSDARASGSRPIIQPHAATTRKRAAGDVVEEVVPRGDRDPRRER